MKKLVSTAGLLFITIAAFGQNAELERIYGGVPTANTNMEWLDSATPNEKYIGVIKVDSTISATAIIDAFISTFQPLQDANIMTRQMRTNNVIGGVLSAAVGDYNSMNTFSTAGDADSRRQYQGQSSWTVQFIDGVRTNRFYYNVSVQARDGRYRLTVTPAGLSAYTNDHIENEWSQVFRNGQVKPMYSRYYDQMKTKLAYTIDQWIKEVDKYLQRGSNDAW